MRSLLAVVALLSAVSWAQSPAGNVEDGRRLYERDGCYECHGHSGQGSRDGPRLADTSLPVQVLIRYVRRPFGAMPAFTEKVVSDRELTDIYAFLKSLPAAKPAKEIPLLDALRDK